MMRRYVEEYDRANGRAPGAIDCLRQLIRILDHKAWEEELQLYRQMAEFYREMAPRLKAAQCPQP